MSRPAVDAPWKKFNGAKRLQAEFKALQRSPLAAGDKPQVDDNLFRWRFRVKNFDEDVAAGKTLNQDLRELARKHGQDHLLMEVQFPPDYPTNPFFLRVVSPRCVMYTGHVTAGGSICIEALVASGGPGGWQADYSVEGVLVLVLANMLHTEARVETLDLVDDDDDGDVLPGAGGHGVLQPKPAAAAVVQAAGPSGVLQAPSRKRPAPASKTQQEEDDDDDVICLSDSDDDDGQPGNRGGRQIGGGRKQGAGAAAAAAPAPRQERGRAAKRPAGHAAEVLSDADDEIVMVGGAGKSAALPGAQTGGAAITRRAQRPAADSTEAQLQGAGAGTASGRTDKSARDSDGSLITSANGGATMPRRVRRRVDNTAAGGAGAARTATATPAAGVVDLTKPSPLGASGAGAGASAGGVAATAAWATGGFSAGPLFPKPPRYGSPAAAVGAAAGAAAAAAVVVDLSTGDRGTGPSSKRAAVQPAASVGVATMAAAGAGGAAVGMAAVLGSGADGASAAVAADAALAAMMSQLEATKAKLEEERRAKERLEAKVKDLAAQALLSKVSEAGENAAAAGGSRPAGGNLLLSAPPPPHWEPMREDEGFGVKLVVLPLPGDQAGGTSSVAAPGSGSPFAPPPLNRAALDELEANGLSSSDAADLLRHCNGNLDEAMDLALQAADCGGIMALLRRQRRQAAAAAAGAGAGGSAADAAAAEAEARAAREQAVREELERVLARFEKASGLSRGRVVRVERVQNWRLWTKYCLRRREVEASRKGGPLNEFYMWHGTSTRVVNAVVTDGFDMREYGALGEGTYFAANAQYSIAYSTRHVVGNNPGAYGAAAFPGMPAFPAGVGLPMPAIGGPVGANLFGFAFPLTGKSGAMMLCRVVMGHLAQGTVGMRKPPAGHDSVYMANTLQRGMGHAPKKKGAKGRQGDGVGPGDDDEEALWHVGRYLGDNLIVSVFDNSQAYPEYIVHID
ncbi:hypothetical protein GPECTOR_25g446 [Gonium pectorale]|uniref:Poly [ADP-ribose] polymerase n=1 Tax=Gonium pectorale TaxID=33097 RepID=A0A150GG96_GONPE|nr:hypothetical protein GPECTOR_25g446 [Gonium pectorale]|eukprot:KXZ48861.1 hypothetical protein GPECTOR_25g446 [Gonium pectorale]